VVPQQPIIRGQAKEGGLLSMRHQGRGDGRYWGAGLVAGLLLAVLAGLGHGQGKPESVAREGHLAKRIHVQVHEGRLSVDLWDAEVSEVLARLGQAAGVVITASPGAGTRVSAQFTDVELEVGLRRLLRLASLSHAIRYAQSPSGAAVVHKVWVFRAAPEGLLPSLPGTARDAEARAASSADYRGRAGSRWPTPPSE
jgi:hypothetical protein